MRTESKQILKALSIDHKKLKYPNVPVDSIPATKYSDHTANGLTRCIIDFLNFQGHQAERINNTGRLIDRRESIIDPIGRSKVIGSVQWIKGTGKNGTADISATIDGRSVKIEVKISKDRQRDSQRDYQEQVENAGGIYFIASGFDQFFDWYIKTFTPIYSK